MSSQVEWNADNLNEDVARMRTLWVNELVRVRYCLNCVRDGTPRNDAALLLDGTKRCSKNDRNEAIVTSAVGRLLSLLSVARARDPAVQRRDGVRDARADPQSTGIH